jgi:hypothetical protein
MAHNNLFEWNPGNGHWYPINRRNIVFSFPASVQRVFFNAVLQGKTVKATAKYSKPQLHILSIDLPGTPTIQTSRETTAIFRRLPMQTELSMFLKGREIF